MLGTFVRIAGCLGLILIASVQATERVIVKDGDTLELGDTTFRLHGIDAPEFNQLSAARLAAIPAGESPANRGVQTLL